MQGSQKDQCVKKLRNIVEKGTKSQDTLIEVMPNSRSAEITEPVLNLKPTSDHDDRYEKFEAFIKEHRDFNKKIESHISSNSIEISGCTIELKDLEQKSKNQAKEVKFSCENHIQAVKDEIGVEVQKLAKQMDGSSPYFDFAFSGKPLTFILYKMKYILCVAALLKVCNVTKHGNNLAFFQEPEIM